MISILGINTNFEDANLKNFTEISIDSKISFLDYDFVIIDTDNICQTNNIGELLKTFDVIKKQIDILLKHSKNIFVLLGNNDIYKGHVLNFLPIFPPSLTYLEGKKMTFCGTNHYNFIWETIKDTTHYLAYFENEFGTPLIKTHNMEKLIATFVEVTNGKIFFLPRPYEAYDHDTFVDWQKATNRFFETIIELDKASKKATLEYSLPSWTEKFLLPNENKEKTKLIKLEKDYTEIQNNIEKQKQIIENFNHYKLLLTATGPQLEEIAINVLSELSLKFTKSERNRADIIATYDNIPIVFEIKGLTKSAGEKDSAQLEKWASEYLGQYNKQAKAILLINGFKDLPLDKRTEPVFPHQMLKYATSREHCLITTTQLLCLYIDIKNNKKDKKIIIEDLLKTVGLYTKYTNYKEYIQSEETISK